MKTQIIKYAYSWNGWQPGLDICNLSATRAPVGITYLRHSTGAPIFGHNLALEPFASLAFKVPQNAIEAIPPAEYGRIKILIDGLVQAEALEIKGDQILPVNSYEINPTAYLRGRMGKASDKYRWPEEGAWHTFVGGCPYSRNNAAWVLQHVFREVAEKYPDRSDSRISVLDASKGGSTPCPGHPVGHTHCADIDLQYLTLGENNYTQWAPSGESITDILTNANALNDLFDVERVHFLFERIIHYFPHCLINVDELILAALPPLPAGSVVGDNEPSYMHKFHAHIHLNQPNTGKIWQ